MRIRWIVCLCIGGLCLFFLAGCSFPAGLPAVENTASLQHTSTASPSPSQTATHTATATITATPTLTPTASVTPTATHTYTPSPTALPQSAAVIGIENAATVRALGSWGAGNLYAAGQLGDPPVIGLFGSLGFTMRDGESGEIMADFPAVNKYWLTPDGTQIILAWVGNSELTVIDSATGQEIRRLAYPIELPRYREWWFDEAGFQTPEMAAFSWDGSLMAVAYGNTDVVIWRLEDGTQVHALKSLLVGQPTQMIFSPTGKYLAVNGWRSLGLWDVAEGRLWTSIQFAGYLSEQPFSWDDRQLVTSQEVGIQIWSILDASVQYTISGALSGVFADDGTSLIVETRGDRHIYNALTGQRMLRSFEATYTQPERVTGTAYPITEEEAAAWGYHRPVTALGWGEDGQLLAVSQSNTAISLWQPFTGHTAFLPMENPVQSLTLQPGQPVMLICTPAALLRWDWQSGISEMFNRCRPEGNLAFTADGVTVLRTNGLLVDLLNPLDVELQGNLRSHTLTLTGVAASPDGRYFASGTIITRTGAEVFLWRTTPTIGLERRLTVTSGNAYGSVAVMAFSPDGSLLALNAGDSQVKVYRVADGWGLHYLDSLGGANTLAFSPDGALLAAGGWGGGITVWDIVTGEQLLSLESAHQDAVNALLFSPDGAIMYSAGADGLVTAWGIP